jgi:uncharacterized membrane-anchored protein
MSFQADKFGDVHAVPDDRQTSMARTMLNKVPEVTVFFWVIKILCTTVGETAADFLIDHLGLGLVTTMAVMSVGLAVILAFQFRARKYVPVIYWLAVVFISVVGTLITDYFTDERGVRLQITTAVFSVILAAVFAIWYASERTLSIHSIVTTKREAFYWLAVLFTFALGTASGDLVAEQMNLGYGKSVLLFAACLLLVYGLFRAGMNPVLSFWLAYILTRPLGASIGDFLSQPRSDGGMGLGTVGTSALFLAAIVGLVAYLTMSRVDIAKPVPAGD